MPLRYFFKATFQKAFDRLPHQKQLLVLKALEELRRYFDSKEASYGLGIKKLYESGSNKTFEARAGIDLRIVWVQTEGEIIFALVGNHEDVQRFLKRF